MGTSNRFRSLVSPLAESPVTIQGSNVALLSDTESAHGRSEAWGSTKSGRGRFELNRKIKEKYKPSRACP